MAARGRTKGFYVYAIMDGPTCLYVGKGSGRRASDSARKHSGKSVILKDFDSETAAFEAEVKFIAELMPQNNICKGGNGGRVSPKSRYELPRALVGIVSAGEWKKSILEMAAEDAEKDRIGQRKYVAKFLCSRLNESNIESFGVSKVGLFRLREVAHG